jgi:hypothetical protein
MFDQIAVLMEHADIGWIVMGYAPGLGYFRKGYRDDYLFLITCKQEI